MANGVALCVTKPSHCSLHRSGAVESVGVGVGPLVVGVGDGGALGVDDGAGAVPDVPGDAAADEAGLDGGTDADGAGVIRLASLHVAAHSLSSHIWLPSVTPASESSADAGEAVAGAAGNPCCR